MSELNETPVDHREKMMVLGLLRAHGYTVLPGEERGDGHPDWVIPCLSGAELALDLKWPNEEKYPRSLCVPLYQLQCMRQEYAGGFFVHCPSWAVLDAWTVGPGLTVEQLATRLPWNGTWEKRGWAHPVNHPAVYLWDAVRDAVRKL